MEFVAVLTAMILQSSYVTNVYYKLCILC